MSTIPQTKEAYVAMLCDLYARRKVGQKFTFNMYTGHVFTFDGFHFMLNGGVQANVFNYISEGVRWTIEGAAGLLYDFEIKELSAVTL